jgi:D-amino-acid dehydrogenase
MRVVVIGAGVIGVATAYYLYQNGHQVVVVDRNRQPALGTSFANGGLLTPSMPEPWNAPGCWRTLLTSLIRSDTPLKLHLREIPALLGWGSKFLWNSRSSLFQHNTQTNLQLALLSLRSMADIRLSTGIAYDAASRGTLRIFRDRDSQAVAIRNGSGLASFGLRYEPLSPSEVCAIEPMLAPIASDLVGGIRYPDDEVGDAQIFTSALTDYLRLKGVQFLFDKVVDSFVRTSGGEIAAIGCSPEHIEGDAFVIASGYQSPALTRWLGFDLPIRPAKGYSVTFATAPKNSALNIPVVDDDLHAAIVPIGEKIRLAGTAEFAGADLKISQARVRNLLHLMRSVLPEAEFEPAAGVAWTGLRPMSADGVPIIGRTPVSNLFVNTGHGHLGWTMAAGSGQLLAALINGDSLSLSAVPYGLERF